MELPPVEHSWNIPEDKEDELPAEFQTLQRRLQEASDAFQGDVPELLKEIERICEETHMEGKLFWLKDDDGRILSFKAEFRSRWMVDYTINVGTYEKEE